MCFNFLVASLIVNRQSLRSLQGKKCKKDNGMLYNWVGRYDAVTMDEIIVDSSGNIVAGPKEEISGVTVFNVPEGGNRSFGLEFEFLREGHTQAPSPTPPSSPQNTGFKKRRKK